MYGFMEGSQQVLDLMFIWFVRLTLYLTWLVTWRKRKMIRWNMVVIYLW